MLIVVDESSDASRRRQSLPFPFSFSPQFLRYHNKNKNRHRESGHHQNSIRHFSITL